MTEEAVSVEPVAVFAEVGALRRASAWSGSYAPITAPDGQHAGATDTLLKFAMLTLSLPVRLGEQFESIAKAIDQGAIDAQTVDMAAPPLVVSTQTTTTTLVGPPAPAPSSSTDQTEAPPTATTTSTPSTTIPTEGAD